MGGQRAVTVATAAVAAFRLADRAWAGELPGRLRGPYLFGRLPRHPGTFIALVADARAGRPPLPGVPEALSPQDFERPAKRPRWVRASRIHLLRCAAPSVRGELVSLLDPRGVQHLLADPRTEPEVRARAFAVHGRVAALALAAVEDQPAATVAELLDLDDPDVNALLYRYAPLDPRRRARILAGEDRDGRLGAVRPSDDLLAALRRPGRDERLRALTGLTSGNPDVLRAMLSSPVLRTEAGRLRLLLALWERHGPDEVRALLDERHFPGRKHAMHPLPAGIRGFTRTLLEEPDGLDRLRARWAEETAPTRVIARIRVRKRAIGDLVDEGVALPWPELFAAHTADPLPHDRVVELLERPDCPREFLLLGLRFGPMREGRPAAWLRNALDQGRITPRDVRTRCRPAGRTVRILAGAVAPTPDREHRMRMFRDWANEKPEAVDPWRLRRDARGDFVRERLGDSIDAWVVAMQLFPRFPGTLLELLDTAAAVAGVGSPEAAPGRG
ncbi:hypothetical protein [Embleya sp. NBC_00896]|uniref:hypothetical protein n=1 Tax=Embleya sp. NBC_00896 TaxID=2975961 RepID=UPI0038705134|nr:hypothetical protein OG928_27510 [Embleya sp. NBC_00896]